MHGKIKSQYKPCADSVLVDMMSVLSVLPSVETQRRDPNSTAWEARQ